MGEISQLQTTDAKFQRNLQVKWTKSFGDFLWRKQIPIHSTPMKIRTPGLSKKGSLTIRNVIIYSYDIPDSGRLRSTMTLTTTSTTVSYVPYLML